MGPKFLMIWSCDNVTLHSYRSPATPTCCLHTCQSPQCVKKLVEGGFKKNVAILNVSQILTSIQQLFHNVEVGMGYTVMEGCIAVAIGHVYDVLQQGRRDASESIQVVLHHLRHSSLLTGLSEPLVLHCVQKWPLEWHKMINMSKISMSYRRLTWHGLCYLCSNSSEKRIIKVKHINRSKTSRILLHNDPNWSKLHSLIRFSFSEIQEKYSFDLTQDLTVAQSAPLCSGVSRNRSWSNILLHHVNHKGTNILPVSGAVKQSLKKHLKLSFALSRLFDKIADLGKPWMA